MAHDFERQAILRTTHRQTGTPLFVENFQLFKNFILESFFMAHAL